MTHHALMLGSRYQRAQLYAAVLDSLSRPTINAAGRVKVAATPREIELRWETGRREALGPDGTPVASDAVAYVDEKITVGSVLRLGDADNLAGTFAGPEDALHRVIAYDEIPDIKGRVVHRTVTLIRDADALVTS